MRWTASNGIGVLGWSCVHSSRGKPSMEEITTVGVDLYGAVLTNAFRAPTTALPWSRHTRET